MKKPLSYLVAVVFFLACSMQIFAQKKEMVKVVKVPGQNKIDVVIGDKLFTSFLYPDSLEKPVLYPVNTASGTTVTRGFPLDPIAGEPTDHPHHLGVWLNFENMNGLDFWNNSFAIPAEKKHGYGWIKTDRITETSGGKTGKLAYHANWTNQQNEVLLEETTSFEFSGTKNQRIVDRTTTFTANIDCLFKDAKDGLFAIRLAHALEIPSTKDQKFTDDKGIETIVKAGTDKVPNGNYLSSERKVGDDVWSTRARWCKIYGSMNNDSVTVAIIDHPSNVNYPTFWHARGYGLFAANPLGEKIFTNDQSEKNLQLKKGESVTFRYRMVVDENKNSLTPKELNKLADEYAKSK